MRRTALNGPWTLPGLWQRAEPRTGAGRGSDALHPLDSKLGRQPQRSAPDDVIHSAEALGRPGADEHRGLPQTVLRHEQPHRRHVDRQVRAQQLDAACRAACNSVAAPTARHKASAGDITFSSIYSVYIAQKYTNISLFHDHFLRLIVNSLSLNDLLRWHGLC
jgi:hypothetical protein